MWRVQSGPGSQRVNTQHTNRSADTTGLILSSLSHSWFILKQANTGKVSGIEFLETKTERFPTG